MIFNSDYRTHKINHFTLNPFKNVIKKKKRFSIILLNYLLYNVGFILKLSQLLENWTITHGVKLLTTLMMYCSRGRPKNVRQNLINQISHKAIF